MALIESTEATLQILWDAALAYYILQASAVYAAFFLGLAHATSFLLSLAGVPVSEVVYLVIALLAATHVMRWYNVPRQGSLRVALGICTVGVVGMAEWLSGRKMQWVRMVVVGVWPLVEMAVHRKAEKGVVG